MARSRSVADRAEAILGTPVVATAPIAGGDVNTATRLRLSDGRSALIKTHPFAPEGFFAAEARGLAWLAGSKTVRVPEVLGVRRDCLVLSWVEAARPTPEGAADLGRALAALHTTEAGAFGADQDGFIGILPLPNSPAPGWVEFYATRRVLPYLKLAHDRGNLEDEDKVAVEGVLRRLTGLAGPDEPPTLVHGDLWSGNVIWTAEGGGTLIDPAAYAGHREADLAMLTLFGLPHLMRALDAYGEAAADHRPLADGWEARQPAYQLFPLLAHAAMFGGRYGSLAGQAARKLL